MKYSGKAHKFGDDVNTDEIIPARYLNTTDEEELASHCMEDADETFAKRVQPGDIIVAGKNFGCGSSREHAPIAIKAAGVSCVIARSFARIFYRNSFNIGLPIFIVDQADEVLSEDELDVDAKTGEVVNKSQEKTYKTSAIPDFMQELIESGGLLNYIKKHN